MILRSGPKPPALQEQVDAVETGITEFEEEFLAHIVLPNGQTVGRWIVPQIAAAYENRDMPAMLPLPENLKEVKVDIP